MNIVYAFADTPGETACSYWLCEFPAMALDYAGHHVALMHVVDFVKKRPKADIIVVERILWDGPQPSAWVSIPEGPTRAKLRYLSDLRVTDAVRHCQSKGAKVLGIFDDHYEAYPDIRSSKAIYDLWHGMVGNFTFSPTPLEQFGNTLGILDGVMTPSKYLCNYYGKYAKRMYYVHNRPLAEMWTLKPTIRYPGDRITIGWSGTNQHLVSWRDHPILTALESLGNKVVLAGIMSSEIADIIRARHIPFIRYKPTDIINYQNIVASCDIGICPLQGEYDMARSWIKWLEFSLMGKPVIGEANGVYDECQGGFLAATTNDWLGYVAMLAEDERVYRNLARQGTEWAWAQGWHENVSELVSVFEDVLSV